MIESSERISEPSINMQEFNFSLGDGPKLLFEFAFFFLGFCGPVPLYIPLKYSLLQPK
jgi:hypothetical protein